MNRKRLYVLLGFLVVAVVCALTAYRLPVLLDPRLAIVETNTFDEIVFRKAAVGDARSQYWVGLYYANGAFGRQKDESAAVSWFGSAAKQGLVAGQLALARQHTTNFFRDPAGESWLQARESYLPAAQAGNAAAQYELGFLLGTVSYLKLFKQVTNDSSHFVKPFSEEHLTKSPELQEAMSWLRQAATNNVAEAAVAIADWLENSPTLEMKDESRSWRTRAAALGDVESMYKLGFWHKYWGEKSESVTWLEKAAENGSIKAMDELAHSYDYGVGVPKDTSQAVRWYLEIAAVSEGDQTGRRSFPSVCFALGLKFERGEGIARDFVEAYKWYNLAASRQWPTADEELARVAQKMTHQQVAEGQRRATEFLARRDARSQQAREGKQPDAIDGVEATGSGFFVTEDGWFCTSYHVVENANKIIVQAKGGKFRAKLVKRDAANDLAILKVEGRFRALPVAASRAVQLGENVFTIGFPNVGLQGFEPKLTRGEVSSIAGIQDDPRHFQISVPVQPGNSGGPLVDMRGNVVGIVRMQMDDIKALKITGSLPQNINYAVKGSLLLSLLESVPALSAKLKQSYTAKERRFEDVVKEAQEATALVLVY